jgi:hypothetical protein
MLTKEFLCKREVLGKRSPHSFTPPSKCGRCVQHVMEIIQLDKNDSAHDTTSEWSVCAQYHYHLYLPS